MFRFSVRELLLLTLVVGIGVAWFLDRRSLAISKEIADDQLQAACVMLRESGGLAERKGDSIMLGDSRGNLIVIRAGQRLFNETPELTY